MSPLVSVALVAWVPFALLLFFMMPVRRAVVVTCVAGWLLLPVAGLSVPGLPDWTKTTAVSVGMLLGLVLRRPDRLLALRPRIADLPMLSWCLVPLASSLANGLGAYDGLAAMLVRVIDWGIPWIVGRAVFRTPAELEELVRGIVLGAVCYVPLCVFEMVMSPQLHRIVYGFHQHDFIQTVRGDGYRPMVFLNHGLMVGLWMTAGTVGAWCLWRAGRLRVPGGLPPVLVVAGLFGTLVFCRSAGALALAVGAIGMVEAWHRSRLALAPLLAVALVPGYLVLRTAGDWHGEAVVAEVAALSEQRAESLAFRFENDRIFAERAALQPVFGWGGWGRMCPPGREDEVVTDTLWIIAYGQNGLVGLASVFGLILVPVLRTIRRRAGAALAPPRWAGTALAAILVVFALDSLLNAMPNPVFVAAAGALAGIPAGAWRRASAAAADSAPSGRQRTTGDDPLRPAGDAGHPPGRERTA